MWLIIIAIACVIGYTTIYSFVLFFAADDTICFVYDILWVRSISTVT